MDSHTLSNIVTAANLTIVVLQVRSMIQMRKVTKKARQIYAAGEVLHRVSEQLFQDYVKVHGHLPGHTGDIICAYCLDAKEMREKSHVSLIRMEKVKS